MKIDSDLLFYLKKIQRVLIERECSPLLTLVAKKTGLTIIEIKKALRQLEKLKIIRKLKIEGDAIWFEFIEKEPISADMLIEKLGFVLVLPGLEKEKDNRDSLRIEDLEKENRELKVLIKSLRGEYESVIRHGKKKEELIEDAIVKHGDY